jgi:hypothetical protein
MENQEIMYQEDVERIVNGANRREMFENFTENRGERVRSKLLESCICLCIVGVCSTLCGIAGWLNWYVALPVSVGVALAASFKFGRVYENAKHRKRGCKRG